MVIGASDLIRLWHYQERNSCSLPLLGKKVLALKDIILIIIAALGWIWGVVLFAFNRKIQKKDKVIEKRIEAYSAYLKKIDELTKNMRSDPQMVYGISTEFMKEIIRVAKVS